MEIKIVATTGKAMGQAVEIRTSKFFIGRHENCQLRPDIEELAGIHALIEQRESRLYLRDFGAEGGTGINDRVLHARETEIFDGDLIQVGPMVLTLSVKSKSEDRLHGLAHAPDDWPYLEGVAAPEVRTPRPVEVAASTHHPTASTHHPTLATGSIPSKFESFLTIQPSSPPDTAVVVSPSPVASASRPASTSPVLQHPIATRPHGRRAISCNMVEDVMVVTLLSPDLNEEETVSPVRYELRTLLDEDMVASKMVIDMGNTRYLSSRAVGVLLAHYQGLERKGSTMRVCGVSKEIKPVLDQMRLSMLIDIYPSVDEAVHTEWD